MPLLEVHGLRLEFPGQPPRPVVDGLDLTVEVGQTTALVGESGCGKTLSALAVMGLVPTPGRVVGGRIVFDGRDLLSLAPDDRRRLRGARIGLISQDPLAALNPVYTVGAQVAEALRAHQPLSRRAAWRRAVEELAAVGLPEPARRAHDYPHQLSGGQRQRVVIAQALACRPALLIADEPTTALDVSVQAQILDLLRRLRAEHNMGLLLITHDLGVVAEMTDHVVVMRAGQVLEAAPVRQLFGQPQHPYTRALLAAAPRLERHDQRQTVLAGEPNHV